MVNGSERELVRRMLGGDEATNPVASVSSLVNPIGVTLNILQSHRRRDRDWRRSTTGRFFRQPRTNISGTVVRFGTRYTF